MVPIRGTVSSGGANGSKAPKGDIRDYGFNAMPVNASTNVAAPKGSAGHNNGHTEELDGPVITSADTAVEPMPEGTVTSGGANG